MIEAILALAHDLAAQGFSTAHLQFTITVKDQTEMRRLRVVLHDEMNTMSLYPHKTMGHNTVTLKIASIPIHLKAGS